VDLTGPRTTLAEAVRERVVVLDGGLATELERRGNELSSALWSARLLRDDPDEIVAVHRAFAAAGAEVATTASYQASFDGFGADAELLLRRSVELARRAGDGWVAASVGPYGAALADGSEYRGDYGLTVAELRRWHRPRLAVLADAGADVLALETIPCLAEVEALLAEVDGLGVPAWLSITCDATSTRAGEPAADAFTMARDCAAVFAVGVNCTDPRDVEQLVRIAAQRSGKPVVAYPNSGERWDAERRAWTGRAGFDPADVARWVEAGARLVGGCCRVGPTQIAAVVTATRPGPARSPTG
jgi:homocysteine S-methyltransferase